MQRLLGCRRGRKWGGEGGEGGVQRLLATHHIAAFRFQFILLCLSC